MQEKLIFLIGSPRSGSTLLQRMVASHSQIATHPEPHLITPLAYLGYYETVDKAPFDHVNAAQALREFCQELPAGEADYLDAVRAYSDTLYSRVSQRLGKPYFLDKTPAYALVLPFLIKLYPKAKYIVLTRHPWAIMHSVAHSFFAGDYAAAHEANPIVSRYVPAIGKFLTERPVPYVHVRYEDLVQKPSEHLRRIFEYLGLAHEEGAVEYGAHKHLSKSYGDPMSVEKHSRPVGDSVDAWAADFLAHPEAQELAQRISHELAPEHLQAWGFAKANLFDALAGKNAEPTRRDVNSYRLKRQVLLALRRNVHGTAFGEAVKRVRYYCDVLLRT